MPGRPAQVDDLVRQAARAYTLRRDIGLSFADIGAQLGVSKATAMRRYWWWVDWGLPVSRGEDPGPMPSIRHLTAPPPGPRLSRLDPAGPELMRLEPRPAVRCRARRRRDRRPCQAFALHGGYVCGLHGGRAPQTLDAAHARHVNAKAAQVLAGLGH